MKTITQAVIKKAVHLADGTAAKNELQHKSYQRIEPMSRSNLTEFIGELLLYLQLPLTDEQTQKGWLLFEALLVQYVELKCLWDKA